MTLTIAMHWDLIQMMKPKTYEYKQSAYPSLHLPKGIQIGLLAQEVEAAIPQLVKEVVRPPKFDNKGKIIHPEVSFKGVNYVGLIPIMIGAIQEQQQTIDSLKEVINDRLANLENRLNGCCQSNQYKTDPNETNQQTVTLTNPQAVILNQKRTQSICGANTNQLLSA
jgi:hypothetical protein